MVESTPRGVPWDVLENDVEKLPLRTGDSFWRRVVENLSVVEFCREIDEARIEDAFRPTFLRKRAEQRSQDVAHGEESTVEGF